MSRVQDLVGKTFGFLRVVAFAGIDEHLRAMWECECACGKMALKRATNLKRNKSISCGCERNAFKRRGNETTKNISYATHMKRARERGLTYLSRSNWEDIVSLPCEYCDGFDIRGYRTAPGMTDKVFSEMRMPLNGVDRVDSSKGYELGNCVPCCFKCNRAKGTLSTKEFIEHVRRIYEKHNKDNRAYKAG